VVNNGLFNKKDRLSLAEPRPISGVLLGLVNSTPESICLAEIVITANWLCTAGKATRNKPILGNCARAIHRSHPCAIDDRMRYRINETGTDNRTLQPVRSDFAKSTRDWKSEHLIAHLCLLQECKFGVFATIPFGKQNSFQKWHFRMSSINLEFIHFSRANVITHRIRS
jgi:hypothetical protein